MSIADKITSIETHLQADWESIENIGGTAEDKNIENIASVVNGIYDNLPKTTGEGSNLSLTTLKGKMGIIPKGDTSQDGTPTPSTPIDIEVVTGTQEVKVSGNEFAEIETQTLNDMKITKTDNGYILNGTASANTIFRATITNPTNSNKTLCVKCDTAITNANIQVKTRSSNATQLRSISLGNANTWVVSSGTFEDYYCDIYVKSGTTLSNVLVQPMLLEGTFTTSNLGKYQSYNEEQTQIVSLGDIELCKIGNYQDYLYKTSGKNKFDLTNVVNKQTTSSINGDSITLTPTATWARIEETINVVAGQTYTISLDFTNASRNKIKLTTFDGTTDTGGPSSSTNTSGSFTFTITPTTTELKVQIYANFSDTLTTNQVTFGNIQVEKGNSKTTYEPYGSDKWYKKEYIGKHILSTSDVWALNRSSNNLYQYRTKNDLLEDVITSPDPYSRPIALCNYYTKGDINGMTTQCFNIGGLKYIGITSDISTLANFNTFITNNSIYVYYVCQTPTDIQITNTNLIEQLDNLEKLKSYNGTTNISSSGNLPMILNVSALKGE